jgi:AraC family transcriptional regulator of adaptative response / DNA-3-methyladenine glycosylase II
LEARVTASDAHLRLRVSAGLVPVLGIVQQRVRQAFDLDADPALIDPALAAGGLPPRAGLRMAGAIDGFESAVRVILGQQVTVAAARTLTSRLVEALGETMPDASATLNRLFPSPQALASAAPETIGHLGIVRQRVGALQALARAVVERRIELHRAAPLALTLDALRALPGIGEWTVQLIAMRVLSWPDAFPASDIGLLRALGTRDVARARSMAEAWRPWRAYAVIRLWQTLEKDHD